MMVVTEADRDKVKQYLKESVKSMERVSEEQAHVSDIVNTLKADHDIPPKISRQIMSTMRKGNAAEVLEEHEMFSDLNEITGGKK